jgi:hypothetical protein
VIARFERWMERLKKKRLVIQTQWIAAITNKDRVVTAAHCEKSIEFP